MSQTINSNGLQNQSEILKRNLQRINYQFPLTFSVFQDKNPIVFLQILHYAVVSYNVEFYKQLIDKGYELFSKNDQSFMQSVYKFLFTEYNYKPQISLEQFFTNIYLEKKLILCNNIIEIIIKNTNEKLKKSISTKQQKNELPKNTKNSNQNQNFNNDEIPIQVKIVRENIPIQELQVKSNINFQDEEDNDEQPRQFQPIAQKSKAELQSNEQTQTNKPLINNKQQLYQQRTNNQESDSNKRDQYFQNKQKSHISSIEQNLSSIKQDIEDIPQQQQYFDKQKQKIKNNMNQINDQFQSIVQYKDRNYDEEELNQGYVQNENNDISNLIKTKNNDTQNQQQTKDNKTDRPVSVRDLNEVMKLIMSLNQTMQETINKLDQFQTNTNTKFQNVNAQLMLLDGEVKLLKAINDNQ